MTNNTFTLAANGLYASISSLGAELRSFGRDGQASLLWDAQPQYWPRSAPILFPVVGRLPGDRYQHQGQEYSLSQHGFARDQRFSVEHHQADRIRLSLQASPETLARYPFPFVLSVEYRLSPAGLESIFTVHNPGAAPMPFAIGGHPGFHWPLESARAQKDYVLVFEQAETAERFLVADGLLTGEQAALPWQGRILALDPALFLADAIVLHQPRSRWVCFQPRQGGLGIRMDFPGFPDLGIWSKPSGAPFLCIEPWHGHASFVNEGATLIHKRDLRILAPGEQFRCQYDIQIVDTQKIHG